MSHRRGRTVKHAAFFSFLFFLLRQSYPVCSVQRGDSASPVIRDKDEMIGMFGRVSREKQNLCYVTSVLLVLLIRAALPLPRGEN